MPDVQAAALNQAGKVIMNCSVRRAKLLDVVRQFELTILADASSRTPFD